MEAGKRPVFVRVIATAVDRMRWHGSGYQLGSDADPATIARMLAYLFGFGAVLLAFTLILPGSPERDSAPLFGISTRAVTVCGRLRIRGAAFWGTSWVPG